jgi:hypothetical protein
VLEYRWNLRSHEEVYKTRMDCMEDSDLIVSVSAVVLGQGMVRMYGVVVVAVVVAVERALRETEMGCHMLNTLLPLPPRRMQTDHFLLQSIVSLV